MRVAPGGEEENRIKGVGRFVKPFCVNFLMNTEGSDCSVNWFQIHSLFSVWAPGINDIKWSLYKCVWSTEI